MSALRHLSIPVLLLASVVAPAAADVTPLSSPAPSGSGMYRLTSAGDGRTILSWLEPLADGGHALRWSRLVGDRLTPAATVAIGTDWFANWADRPSVVAVGDRTLFAHWLVKSAASRGAGHAYGLRVAHSGDAGATWRVVFEDHLTAADDYSGFLTFLPHPTGVTAVFLRPLQGAPAGAHVKTLAVQEFALDGTPQGVPRTLDADTCTCCPTSAAMTSEGPVLAYRDHDGEFRDIALVRRQGAQWTAPARVHDDLWRMPGCPVNGPALAAHDARVALAWFTAADDAARVQVAFSQDAGQRFGRPVRVDDGSPVGWAATSLLEDGSAVVSWLEAHPGGGGRVRLRRVHPDGRASAATTVADAPGGRTTGMPELARAGDRLLVAWRDEQVRVALVQVPALPPPSPADTPPEPPQPPPPSVTETVDVVGARPLDRLGLDSTSSTASRLGLTSRELPATVVIVDRTAIEERGALDTQEILASVPGMTAASPPGSAGAVSYRGFGGGQLTQLFNGITVQYDAVAARPVDSWIYDRVEVIGGPSTFLFGAGAVGGSINYITRLATAARNTLDARVAYASFGTTEVSGGANRHVRSGRADHAVRLDASRTDTSGYVTDASRGATTGAASWRFGLGARLAHTLALEGQHERADRAYWGTPLLNPAVGEGRIAPATRFANYNSRDGFYEQDVFWGRSLTEYRPGGSLALRNTVYRYDARRDFRNVEVYRFTADNSAVIRSAALLQRHDQVLTGNRLEAQWAARLLGRQMSWSAGLDVSRNRQTRFPRSLPATVSIVNPFAFETEAFLDIPGMLPTFVPDRNNRVDTMALFAEYASPIAGGLTLVSGIRHDRLELSVRNQRTVTPTDPALFERSYRPTTGRVGLTYALGSRGTTYVQYSTAADPPAGILTTATFGALRDFDLTTGRQAEAGAKLDLPARLGVLTAAVYRITRNNLAIADPLTPAITQAVGQQSSRGVELALAMRPARGLAVQGHASFTDATFDAFVENVSGVGVSRAGNLPPNTPRWVSQVFGTYTWRTAWQAGADVRHVSRRYGNAANTIADGSYVVAGAFLGWQARPGVSLQVRGRNLGDTVYARSVTGAPMFFLGAPRTIELAVRLSR